LCISSKYSKCISAIKRILYTTAMYISSSSFVYLCFSLYCGACWKSSALRVRVKTLHNTYIKHVAMQKREWMRNRNENTQVKPKRATFIAARFHSTLLSKGKQFCCAAKQCLKIYRRQQAWYGCWARCCSNKAKVCKQGKHKRWWLTFTCSVFFL